MADNKSCEELAETLSNCLPITYEDSLLLIDRIMKGDRMLSKVGESAEHTGKKMGEQMVKLDVDVSDALKGLKAVQREAKKATKLLKEVEGRKDVKDLSDDELLAEFASRGWEMEDACFYEDDSETPKYRQVILNKNKDKTGG